MTINYTEASYENSVIELFKNMSYKHSELWTDNTDMHETAENYNAGLPMAAEDMEKFN